ncbi:MAG: undecaprenyl-diphosphate phosphatase [Verrucomicrobia bacterium]|jgi:undecaprenyl-diphosphatase|nr:undecaprenyl-diphosphate phosphatase [Verrucomicrobiota bacterium]
MQDWLAAIILGVVEGITEFLPVSSTGHLLIVEKFLHADSPFLQSELFNVGIQSGAVLAVILNFKQRLQDLAQTWKEPETLDYLVKLSAAFFVTGVGGIILKKLGMRLPETVGPVAWATLIGGVLFIAVEYWLRGKQGTEKVTWIIALAIGVSQLVAAAFPGASRSGTTILVALILGLSRPRAIEFSFLLGVPTLIAAGGLSFVKHVAKEGLGSVDWLLLALGFVTATITAFITVKWLLKFVQSHTFVAFGWYRIILGAALLLFFRG